MKRILVVLLGVFLSVVSFSMSLENIPKEIFIKAGVSEANLAKAIEISKAARPEIEKNNIEAKKTDLDIKYLLLSDVKDWGKIKALMSQSAEYRIAAKISSLKVKEELKKYITFEQFRTVLRELRKKENDKMKFKKEKRGNRFQERGGNSPRIGQEERGGNSPRIGQEGKRGQKLY